MYLSTHNMGFPGGSDGKEAFCNARDLGLTPGSGRSLAEGNGHPLQYSCLENPMDRGAWWGTVHGVAESGMTGQLTQLSGASSLHLPTLLSIGSGSSCITGRTHKTWASQVALVAKNPPASAGDTRDVGSIPVLGRSPGGGHGNPLQCSCLENPMDRGAWWATVHGAARSRTPLKGFRTRTRTRPRQGLS